MSNPEDWTWRLLGGLRCQGQELADKHRGWLSMPAPPLPRHSQQRVTLSDGLGFSEPVPDHWNGFCPGSCTFSGGMTSQLLCYLRCSLG